MTNTKWDDPKLWTNVKWASCKQCGKRHVTRDLLCWACEQAQNKRREHQVVLNDVWSKNHCA